MNTRNRAGQRSPIDLSAVIGTVASLAAFAVMGFLVHNMMWRPIELRELESVGPEEPAKSEAPAAPRKTNTNLKFTA